MLLPLLCIAFANPSIGALPAETLLPAAAISAPQGPTKPPSRPAPQPQPTGGTPEPTILLLTAGAVAAYGGFRLSRRKQSTTKEN